MRSPRIPVRFTASVVNRLEYGPFGAATVVAGTVDRATRQYAGHRFDAVLGIGLAAYRALDPALGRWISQDPIGLAGGPNHYAYVAGNPVRRVDTLGLRIDCWSSARFEFVDKLPEGCPTGSEGCTKASMSYSAPGPCVPRDSCYAFDATVNVNVAIYLLRGVDYTRPSKQEPGTSLLGHELNHAEGFLGICPAAQAIKSEGFPSPSACEGGRKAYAASMKELWQMINNAENRRDGR